MKINSNNVPWSILYKIAFLDRIEKNSKAPFPQNQLVSLRNRTGEEGRRQTLCDRRDNNFVWKNFPPSFTLL